MGTLSSCLKKIGLSKHEAAILRGATDDNIKDGDEAHVAAVRAVSDFIEQLEKERAGIEKQVLKASGKPTAAPFKLADLAHLTGALRKSDIDDTSQYLPEGANIERGTKGLANGKVRAVLGEDQSNWHNSPEDAAKELIRFIDIRRQNEDSAEKIANARSSVAEKLRDGVNPSFAEWKQAFPQINSGHTYIRQPDISPFLVEHFGFKQNAISANLGDAAGFVTTDSGTKYQIVYFNKLAPVLAKIGATESSVGQQQPDPAKINDFGEKLEGAKKFMPKSLEREISDYDIATQPLSKIWPADEIDGMENKFAAAVAFAARAYIPAKPRKDYLVKRWVEKVKILRGLAQKIVTGAMSEESFKSKLFEFNGLDGFKDKVALLEAIDRAQWKRIGDVNSYPNAYRYGENGEQIKTAMVRVEIDGKRHLFDDASSVADVVEKVNGLLGVEAQAKKMQFEVRGRGNSFSINKAGDKEYRKLKTFATTKEAFAYIKDNYDDLVAAWEGVKERDNVTKADMRNAENRPRTGQDWREGKDVTEQQFAEALGFRGVQFGNWVGQGAGSKDRQGMLNQAYDALMDLAAIVGVPPKAISLNGSLGLSFGARGSGHAAAHFEPDMLVINLTKTKGAGSLAHEWFHALDNYFSRQRGGEIKIKRGLNAQQAYRNQNFITYRPEPMYVHKSERSTPMTKAQLERNRTLNPKSGYFNADNWHKDPAHPQGVRPEVERAFAELVEALDESPMKARSAANDKAADGYWSRIIERGARAFENYVISRMMENGYHNDYLANVKSVEDFPRAKERYPYLLPEEIKPISDAFDNLFATVETKETDSGVAIYNKTDGRIPPEKQLSESTVVSIIEPILEKFGGADIPVRILESEAHVLPVGVGMDDDHVSSGVVYQGRIHLFRDGLADEAAVVRTLFHEMFHYGIRRFMSKEQYIESMQHLYKSDATIRNVANAWLNTKEAKDLYAKTKDGDYVTARGVDEALADVAAEIKSRNLSGLTIFNKKDTGTFEKIKNWLSWVARKFGFDSVADMLETKSEDVKIEQATRDFVLSMFDRLESGESPQNTLRDWAYSDPAFMTVNANGKKASEAIAGLNAAIEESEGVADAFSVSGDADQSMVDAFAKVFGIDLIAVKPNNDQASQYAGISFGGKIYANASHPRYGFSQLAGHELLHQLKQDAPGIYEYFAKAASERYIDGAEQRYASQPENAGYSADEIGEELLADFVGDALADRQFLERLAKKSPSKFKQFADYVLRWLDGVAKKLTGSGFGSSQYFTDIQGLRNELANVLMAYSDAKSVSAKELDFDPGNSDIRYRRSVSETLESMLGGEASLSGDSGRDYDAAQRDFFKRIGREATRETLFDKTRNYLKNDFWKKMAVGIVDQFRGLRDLNDNGQAYMLARLSKGTAGAFEALLHHGKLSLKDGVYDADQSGGVIDRLGVPLHGELDDFLWWVAANRAEGLAAEDRENLFTPEDIAAGKSLAQGETWFDYTIQTGPDQGKVTRNRAEIYADANRVFNEFQKNALDMAEQSGLIDGASRQYWESEFYVPFYRVSEDDGEFVGAKMGQSLVRQQAFKKLKGGTDKLNSDLLSNTLLNWSHLIEASAKNRAARAALEAAELSGAAHRAAYGEKHTVWHMGEVTRKIPKGETYFEDGVEQVSDGTAEVTQIGKIEYGVDDPFVMTAITSLEYAGMRNGIMDAMTAFKHWMTVGVTASPAFKVRNLIRDSIQAIGTSDLGYNPIANIKEGIEHTKRDSQQYVSALASGGLIRFGTMLEGRESDRIRQLIKSGVKDSSIIDNESKWRQFYDKYLEPGIAAYNELGNRSEEINRAALYSQLIKQGKSHAEAALLARDLMDFSMQGSFNTIRFLTQVVPFMNARLQGFYKLGRSAKDDPRKLAVVTGAVAMASIALMAAYGDDDDWKRREDWDRDNFWWFKFAGLEWRIPKPFEVGAIGTLAERSVEYLISDEMTGDRFRHIVGSLVANNMSMNPVPQAFKPILDLYANKDSFTGRPIETMGMQRLDSTQRYNSNTSLVARGLSNATMGVLSPVQYDHVARAYLGWLGSFAVGGADLVARQFSSEPTKPALDYWKFATQGIIKEAGTGSSRYVTMIYDQAKELEQAHATYRQMLKDGKVAEAAEYSADHKDELRRYKQVEKVKRAEAKFNERIREVERSDMTPSQKRENIERLTKYKEAIAKRVAPGYGP